MKKLVLFSLLLLVVAGCTKKEKDRSEVEIGYVVFMAKKGNADAVIDLGMRYFFGVGEEKNEDEAVKWWRKAAEQGNLKAQIELVQRYTNGDGMAQDIEEALKWMMKNIAFE